MNPQRRTIHPEIRILDLKKGLVEYVASDETLDSYREIIRADGWRFNHFQKNAPFVDSHDYGSVDRLLGKVVSFEVQKKKLVEVVQWAVDAGLPEDHLANIGWRMTVGGYLKAVSVGFWPVRMVSKWDNDPTGYAKELIDLGLDKSPDAVKPRAIYQEQEQIELSAVIIGANPNALAKAYKAAVLNDADLERISGELAARETARIATSPDRAMQARGLARRRFLERFEQLISKH